MVADQERLEQRDAQTIPAPPPAAARLASTAGNRAFAQLARSGGGILPSGRVHPDVQASIDGRRGGGAALDATTRGEMAAVLGDSLADVRVHADTEAGTLARAVDARAFTTGSDIFFGPREYSPHEAAGRHLLAHELTHVVQQRGAPVTGPMEVTQPGDAHELDADAVADGLRR